MWRDASAAKVAATRGYGATVDLDATGPGEAFDRLRSSRRRQVARSSTRSTTAREAGQGTVGLELLEDAPDVETILVPTGGGGLVAGIAARGARPAQGGRSRAGAVDRRARALAAGRLRGGAAEVDRGRALGAVRGADALEVLGRTASRASSSPRSEIEEAFRFLYERAKLACEPAGAVGVAAILAGKSSTGRVAVVVSGGNVEPEIASAILARR